MSLDDYFAKVPKFAGSDYEPFFDYERLSGQIRRIFDLMRDGEWRTLPEIREKTGDPTPSISAQLRHLRKHRFGSHTVNKRARGDRHKGLFEYQLLINRSPYPEFVKNIIFKENTAELNHVVPRPRWQLIHDFLVLRDYQYLGRGKWEIPRDV